LSTGAASNRQVAEQAPDTKQQFLLAVDSGDNDAVEARTAAALQYMKSSATESE
jgi:hypothetical protein